LALLQQEPLLFSTALTILPSTTSMMLDVDAVDLLRSFRSATRFR
jgi:hypothetical protein